jgi:hypothetical protein
MTTPSEDLPHEPLLDRAYTPRARLAPRLRLPFTAATAPWWRSPAIFQDHAKQAVEFHVNANIPYSGLDLYIKTDATWVNEVKSIHVETGQRPPVAMRPTTAQGQDLLDRLYRAGFRPTEARGGEGTLAATQKHLEDMRAITFDKLAIDPP